MSLREDNMFSATLALLLAAQHPAAQSDIVVTAYIPDRQSVHRYVSDISRTVEGQLARLRDPVCPEVLGMPAEPAARIARRIRDVAAYAGLRVGRDGCVPNVSLFFALDGDSFIREAGRRYPSILAGVSAAEVRRLESNGQGARAWQIADAQPVDGGRVVRRSQYNMSGPASGVPPSNFSVHNGSNLNPSSMQVVRNAVVVIEMDAAIGKSLTQLADYTAMVALAGAQPPASASNRADTILTLFDSSRPPPPRMTRLDYQYLTTLYDLPADRRAQHQLSSLSARMVEALQADIRN
jgi:hypothetical protein